MASAEVDICNQALSRIGQKRFILSLAESTTEARVCNLNYPLSRDAALAAAWWPFATKRQTLAALPTTRTGWGYAYAFPTDCLMPRFISNGARPGANLLSGSTSALFNDAIALEGADTSPPVVGLGYSVAFTVEASDDLASKWILTDQASAELVYTGAVTAAPMFPALFVDALAWKLAAELAFALPVKKDAGVAALAQYKASLAQALAAEWRGTREDRPRDARYISRRG